MARSKQGRKELNSLTRADIAKALADKFDGAWDYAGIVDSVFDQLAAALAKGQKVELRGFGSWSVKRRKRSKGRNFKTGETLVIPAYNVVDFNASPALRSAIQSSPDIIDAVKAN